MKKLTRVFLTVLMPLILTVSGCAAPRTNITYTVYPVGFLIERLGGDLLTSSSIQEETIVQRAQIRADYEEILENSNVFFYIGRMEPYLTMYSSRISELVGTTVDLSILNAVYDFQRYTQVVTGDTVTYIESPYYSDKSFDMIDVDTKDLYLWTDPIAMLSMAKDIRDWMIETYPDDKSIFDNNFSKIETDLINLDAQYQALSTNNLVENKVIRFVSMTASFGNWQKTYGFEVYPVILSKYGVLPNEDQLNVIKQRIIDDGVKYIVYEPNMTEDMVELFNQLQEELNLTRVELSNLSSLTSEDIELGKDYLSIMYENLQVLETMAEDRTTGSGDTTETPINDETEIETEQAEENEEIPIG